MDELTAKLGYLAAEVPPRKRRSIWTFLSLVSIGLDILAGVASIPFIVIGLLSDDPKTMPGLGGVIAGVLVALAGAGFTCGMVGLVATLRNPQKYALPDAILGAALTGLILGWLLVHML